MSGYPTKVAGYDGKNPSPYMFWPPRRFAVDYSPILGGYTRMGDNSVAFLNRSVGGGSSRAYVFNLSTADTLFLTRPIALARDITPNESPAAGLVTIRNIKIDYLRQTASDVIGLKIYRQNRSNGYITAIVTYTSTEFSTTAAWAQLNNAVSLALDEVTYTYGIELELTPNSNGDDARFGQIELQFEIAGLRPHS